MQLGNAEQSEYYFDMALERLKAISEVFWNEEMLQWFDYNLQTSSSSDTWYVTNYFPLWGQSFLLDQDVLEQIFAFMTNQNNALSFPAG
jgi:neutral trehalase